MLAYSFALVATILCVISVTPLIISLACRYHIVDSSTTAPQRKRQPAPVPLLGGLAVYISLAFMGVMLWYLTPLLSQGFLHTKELLALFLGATVIVVGGYLDDRYHLPPQLSVLAPIVAAIIVVLSGVGVNFITSPWGGVVRIDIIKLPWVNSVGIPFSIGAMLFTFFWMMGAMYTTKIMDGLDGLVAGVTAIGALILVGLSLRPPVLQPDTAMLSLLVAAAFFGFLFFNWSPAKIYLGEGGSVLAGFLLGSIAIIAGGKIATTALILGMPILDVLWAIIRRWRSGYSPFTMADRQHVHFQLLDTGLTVRQVVLLAYSFTALIGLSALYLPSRGKFATLLILPIVFIVLIWRLTRKRVTAT